MPRKANCRGNAPQESFYGHMKDGLDIPGLRTFEEVLPEISSWTGCCNNGRCQWDLAKLSPRERHKHLETGVYPLVMPKPEEQA